MGPCRGRRQRQAVEPLLQRHQRALLVTEANRPLTPDAADGQAERRQPLVGIVGPEGQPELGAGREHAVRFGYAPAGQVVHHDADIALVPADRDGIAAARRSCRIQPCHDPLPGRLLVAGGAVDLAGKEQALTRFVSRLGPSSRGSMWSYSIA